MRVRVITYSDYKMTKAANLCVLSGLKNGCDEMAVFSQSDLPDYFIGLNLDTLNAVRGCGYWLWKPAIIELSMRELKDNDILIYSDAGVELIAPVSNIINRMDQDIFFFTNGFPQVEWCKADVLNTILGWGMSFHKTDCGVLSTVDWAAIPYDKQKQVQASVIFFKVNQNTRSFVKEWLLYCQMPGFIDDSPSKLPNYPTFAEHRHDQAILTCLQIKYGYKLHFWPTNYSEHIRHTAQPEDTYPTMFLHHRKRNSEW